MSPTCTEGRANLLPYGIPLPPFWAWIDNRHRPNFLLHPFLSMKYRHKIQPLSCPWVDLNTWNAIAVVLVDQSGNCLADGRGHWHILPTVQIGAISWYILQLDCLCQLEDKTTLTFLLLRSDFKSETSFGFLSPNYTGQATWFFL